MSLREPVQSLCVTVDAEGSPVSVEWLVVEWSAVAASDVAVEAVQTQPNRIVVPVKENNDLLTRALRQYLTQNNRVCINIDNRLLLVGTLEAYLLVYLSKNQSRVAKHLSAASSSRRNRV